MQLEQTEARQRTRKVRLDRVDSRGAAPPRRDPYWQRLSAGRFVGFRKMMPGSSGTWLAREYDGERYRYTSLGDLAHVPDKARFDEAKRAAESWFQHLDMGGTLERVTVRRAC